MRGLLSGESLVLDAVGEGDLPCLGKWFNDTGFMRHYDTAPARPMTPGRVRSLLSYYESSDERLLLAVRYKETGQMIGIAGFDEIIWSNATATVFIGIGEKEYTGKGLGAQAMRLLIDFGFSELNFHRIQLNVISYNEPAIRLYESLGFVREGAFREYVHRDGKRYDLLLYALLRREWK